jgi:uncharacterized membrane protein YgdD (TMEM256/DUF423 family)
MKHRTTLLAASLLGLTGVGLGAFGAHALRELLLERGMSSAWETAARYQLNHAVAVLAAAAWLRAGPGPGTVRLQWAVRCWTVGTVLFSGSLYGVALGGPHLLVFLTPLGGGTLIAGWLMAVAAAFVVKDP